MFFVSFNFIVPDEETLKPWAVKNGFENKSFVELCKDDGVRKAILNLIKEFGKANDLKGFENVKSIFLEHEPFSVDNGLLTPTFKLKRHEAKVMLIRITYINKEKKLKRKKIRILYFIKS